MLGPSHLDGAGDLTLDIHGRQNAVAQVRDGELGQRNHVHDLDRQQF